MDIFRSIIFGIAGFFLFTFITLQTLLVLTCGLPITKKLKKYGLLLDARPYKKIIITIINSLFITAVVVVLILLYATPMMIKGFFIGIAIAFFFSLPRLGMKDDNVSDWMNSIDKSVDYEFIEQLSKDED